MDLKNLWPKKLAKNFGQQFLPKKLAKKIGQYYGPHVINKAGSNRNFFSKITSKITIGAFSSLKHDFWLIIDAFCTIFHGESEFDRIDEKVHFLTGDA